MGNGWLFFMDQDGGSQYIFPAEPSMSHSFGVQIISQVSSFVDNSLALQEAFNCISKFAGVLLFWFSSGSSSNTNSKVSRYPHGSRSGSSKPSMQVKHIISSRRSFTGFRFSFKLKGQSAAPVFLSKVISSTVRHLCELEQLQSIPVLSLAAALVPPFDNLTTKTHGAPLHSNNHKQMHGCMDQRPCEVEQRSCASVFFPDLNWTRQVVEPRTGIEFPRILQNIFSGENSSSLTSEVLVGTGSRSMKVIKIKSLKVYAFGFYVHPYSVCEKLSPKYASMEADELINHNDFYNDLLREDISMTVRLVVNCMGIKVNTVKDAFEKSLQARLSKVNPETDYHCLATFGSYFTKDIPLPVGTIIDFQRTADGQLITKIGGNQIGAVHSKDLCRAFFDMYIGEVPVSEQTKEEIGRNVVNIIRRC